MPTRPAIFSKVDPAKAAPSAVARKRYREVAERVLGMVLLACATMVGANQIDIVGPTGSVAFGSSVTVLPNGNFVVTDPSGLASNRGAVYLYSPAGVLISTLTGSTPNDSIGNGRITVLSNGHYVILSPSWNNGPANVGAVTWGNADTGVSGVVSASNSLIGTTASDRVGSFGVTALSNGNYVVRSPQWDNGSLVDAGAATWGNGSTGTSGAVSASNSLIGTTASDQVGSYGVTALSNGNYVVGSPVWDNGGVANVGAATWGNGSTGTSGIVSASNSLIGTKAFDEIGSAGATGVIGVTALSNGNYVVDSPFWDNGALVNVGAATWGNGSTRTSGTVSASNSLIGTTADDQVGRTGVVALSNGNYVVGSDLWDNGAVVNVGAATWGNGSTGTSGAVSASNSLIGTTADDQVGSTGVTALSNGNYVVRSNGWDNGAVVNVGAATWGNGSTGTSGAISASNSLLGATANDFVGSSGVTALSNGNYVVGSPFWSNGAVVRAGAATWGNGSTGTSGAVSASNSLIGTTANDNVGSRDITALSNGNYVVRSFNWDNGGVADAGAATWGNGSTGTSGAVSASNSLIGTTASDQVGSSGVTALSNGNYVVGSRLWHSGGVGDAGAATWGNGSTGTSGTVSASNSLIGTTASDQVGSSGVTALSNGNYVVHSNIWDNGALVNAGAITLARGVGVFAGTINSTNSVLGTVASPGSSMVFGYDAARDQLVVGRPASNIVTIFHRLLGALFKNGFESPPPPASAFAKEISLAAADSGRATLDLMGYGEALTAEAWAAVILVNGANEIVAAFELRQGLNVEVRLALVEADGWHYGEWTSAAADAVLTLTWSSHDGVHVDRLGVESASRRITMDAPR